MMAIDWYEEKGCMAVCMASARNLPSNLYGSSETLAELMAICTKGADVGVCSGGIQPQALTSEIEPAIALPNTLGACRASCLQLKASTTLSLICVKRRSHGRMGLGQYTRMMEEEKIVMLIEDNPDDEALSIRALKRNNLKNKIFVARDGVQALDYLFGVGKYSGRDTSIVPVIILLDLYLPKISGLEILRRLRFDPRTKSIPVTVLTSSNEDKDIIECRDLNVNSFIRNPVNMSEFNQAVKQSGLYWVLLNEPSQTDEALQVG